MGTKLGFSIESSLASKHLTDAQYIKGGYFVVKDIDERGALQIEERNADGTIAKDGTIVKGSKCFCQADGKEYVYDGNGWVEKTYDYASSDHDHDDDYVQVMPCDEDIKSDTNFTNRPFCSDFLYGTQENGYKSFLDSPRAYVENTNGGINPFYYIDPNASKLFNPYGYYTLDELKRVKNWGSDYTPTEGEDYKKVTRLDEKGNVCKDEDDNVLYNYHPRLRSIVARTTAGTVRTGTPTDSSDAVNLQTLNERIGGIHVVAQTEYSTDFSTLPLRDEKGEIRCRVSDDSTFDSTACINKQYATDYLVKKDNIKFPDDKSVVATITLGGIAEGDDLKGKSFEDILKLILTNYAPLSFDSITTDAAAGIYEYGTSLTVSTVTPTFALGTKPITSVEIGTDYGQNKVYENKSEEGLTSIESGKAIDLGDASIVCNGTTSTHVYCTLKAGTDTAITKYASIYFRKYNYVAVTDDTGTPSVGVGKGYAQSNTTSDYKTFGISGKYIWFLLPDGNALNSKTVAIEYSDSGGWKPLTTTKVSPVYFITEAYKSTETKLTYHAYRAEMPNVTNPYCRIVESTGNGDGNGNGSGDGNGNGSGDGNGNGSGDGNGNGTTPSTPATLATFNYVLTTNNGVTPKSTSIATGTGVKWAQNIGEDTRCEITTGSGEYVWFFMKNNNLKYIHLDRDGKLQHGQTTALGEVELTTKEGNYTFYAYRTGKLGASTETYEIKEKIHT